MSQINSHNSPSRKQKQIDKTRRWISEALVTMLEDASIGNITIKQICTKAGVGRQTFYRHFSNKRDVIRFELQVIQDEVLTLLTSDQNNQITDYTIHLTAMNYLQKHAYLTGLAHSPDFRTLFIDNMYESRRRIDRKFEIFTGQNIYDEQFRFGGIAAVILSWIERGMEESPETIAKILTRECALLSQ